MLAGTTIPLLDACILEPSTTISLTIIMITTHIGINGPLFCHKKHIKTELINTLSAMGSHNFPKSLTQLNLRAK
jgi:hypothetical protein